MPEITGHGAAHMHPIRVSNAITITDLKTADQARYVVTNEATGKHFSADASAIRFLDELRASGDVARAATRAGITPDHAARLTEVLLRNGIAAGDGLDVEKAAPKQPLEGKLISIRMDVMNAGPIARRLTWLGRIMFSAPFFLVWLALIAYAIAVFAGNTPQVAASMRQLTSGAPAGWLAVAVLYVGIKVIHELGHVLAYRVTCLREGLDPGPIRVGLMVFAGTPFPYTDVTGAWRLSSRWRRALIGAAGIYFESTAVTLLVLAWARLNLGALEPVILQVAVFAGAATLLFNLNPAVKLDGYYILTDLLRQPNLFGRASQAARGLVWRLLGASAPRSTRLELVYWVVSYAYRWTIFAGIFWIAYRFDPRLGGVVAVVALLLLVVRPITATLRPILSKAAPMRLTVFALVCLAGLALMFVPFKARLLAEGQIFGYRTEVVRPPEEARLVYNGAASGRGIAFEQPDLAYDRLALETRVSVLENMARQRGLGATEIAALEADRAGLETRLAELDVRIARLKPQLPDDTRITPFAADAFDGQWVSPFIDRPLAAVSSPVEPYVVVRLPQNRLETDMTVRSSVRLTANPACEFDVNTVRPWSEAIAREGVIEIEAAPSGPLPACAADVRNGAGVIMRVPLSNRSIAERLVASTRRLLQERLPFEQERQR